MNFTLTDIGMKFNNRPVLADVTAELRTGQLTAIVGPNGAGKSTLLSIMAGLRRDYQGQCHYGDRAVRKWPRRTFAQSVAFVPQSLNLEFPFTAEQVVLMGRAPHADRLFEGDADRIAVERAMRLTDTLAFATRDFRTLSGGERQRVVLASALAQSPKFLLLDEPATFLDLRHQIGIYRLIRDLCREGLGAVAVTHDLNTAVTYADRVLLLENGRIVADGPPREALNPERIQSVFGITAEVHGNGRPWIVYEP